MVDIYLVTSIGHGRVCICFFVFVFFQINLYISPVFFFFKFMFDEIRENALELLQRYRRDRRVLLDYMLSGSLIKKVVMPPGAVTLDDVDLDQVSVDYVLNCVKKGIVCF